MASTASSKTWRFCALVLLAASLPQATAQQSPRFREVEKQLLDQVLSYNYYDPRLRPTGVNGTDDSPTIVRVNIFFRMISRIDDRAMEYDVQLTFREHWVDDRLKYQTRKAPIKYLTLTDIRKLWMPDVFFSNEKRAHFHDMVMPNTYIRIFPRGDVLYSTRISMTLTCPMNLKLYPHDRQMCNMRLASYGWTTDDLVLLWKIGDPVQVVKNLQLPRYTLEQFSTDYCNSKTNTGEYSCLKVDLLLKREFNYYLIHIYVPTVMLVMTSWLSFWLGPRAVTARTFLVVTTMLTISIQTAGVRAWLPVVNYVMAVDVWLGACVSFVFAALLQGALVSYLAHSEARRGATARLSRLVAPEHSEISEALAEGGSPAFAMKLLEERPQGPAGAEQQAAERGTLCHSPLRCWRAWLAGSPTVAQRADAVSRILFPLAFSLFCLVYCCVYVLGD